MTTRETNDAINELMAQVSAVVPESRSFSAFSLKCAVEVIVNKAVEDAQAPLVRVLLECEIVCADTYEETLRFCGCCECVHILKWRVGPEEVVDECQHKDCSLDAALTAAGLATQASRDEARAAIAARVKR